jgi:hypothetical protein
VKYPVMAIVASAPAAAAGSGSMKMQDCGGMMQMEKRRSLWFAMSACGT